MPVLRNIKLTLSYDGTDFNGWQHQKGLRTVQGVLEDALDKIFPSYSRLVSAGRTDAGVHALGQVVNFFTPASMETGSIKRALNSLLPEDVYVRSAEDVEPAFHARFMAESKTYVYIIDTAVDMNPFIRKYALQVSGSLDIRGMEIAAGALVGEHDFSSFMGSGSSVKTVTRKVFVSTVFVKGSRVYYIIRGSGFLRHMVRNIVGTLIKVGQAKIDPEDIVYIMNARDRTKAGPTAPPQGLYLLGVSY